MRPQLRNPKNISEKYEEHLCELTVARKAKKSSIASLRETTAFVTCRATNASIVTESRIPDAVQIPVDRSVSCNASLRTTKYDNGDIVNVVKRSQEKMRQQIQHKTSYQDANNENNHEIGHRNTVSRSEGLSPQD